MWGSICYLIGQTVATSVTIEIESKYSINLAYRIYGGVAILAGFICTFTLKDYPEKPIAG